MSMAALLFVPGSLALVVMILVLASWLEGLAPRPAEARLAPVPLRRPGAAVANPPRP